MKRNEKKRKHKVFIFFSFYISRIAFFLWVL
jgi:hypothetical protein